MATKKKPIAKKVITAPKAVAKKVPAKKVATKKVVSKPMAKKVVAKAVVKKAVAKTVVKKVVAKAVVKKAVSKAVVKKVEAKAAVKKAAVKVVAKKVVAKVEVKKVVASKTPAKKVAAPKVIDKKVVAPKVEVKKAVVPIVIEKKEKPAPIPKPEKVAKVKKAPKSTTKTIFSPSTPVLPKKSDVFKPTVSNIPTLRNDTGKVIAHRKTEDMKRKAVEDVSATMIEYVPEYNKSILDLTTEDLGPRYRYSDEDLIEFRELITKKLETARNELHYLQGLITRKDEAGTEDTENKFAGMEEGSESHDREQLNQLASRQIKFIGNLEQAMVRVENKTYGICRVTGKLIDKARLRAVPHATLSIDAKNAMNKN
jgi:RNA polymerase-binding transcription factor DksA